MVGQVEIMRASPLRDPWPAVCELARAVFEQAAIRMDAIGTGGEGRPAKVDIVVLADGEDRSARHAHRDGETAS